MYAVPHMVTITDPPAAAVGLGEIVPQTSSFPGFVAGYWVARSADQGLALVIFDSEQTAQNFADFLKSVPDSPGVTMDRESIGVCEVLAYA